MCNKNFFHVNKQTYHSLLKHNQINHVNNYTSFAALNVHYFFSSKEDELEEENWNDGVKLSSGSVSVSAPVLDLTLTPVHIPGTLGANPIGAAEILSNLTAIRQQTLDDFIIDGGQKIKRAAAFTKNVPYPFIRDPANFY